MDTLAFVGVGLTFIGVGLPLWFGYVPANRFYGFRTSKTLARADVWWPVNRVFGVDLVIAGVITAVMSLTLTVVLHCSAFRIAMLITLALAIPLAIVRALSLERRR